MRLHATDLPGVMWAEPTVHVDDRGWFMESWHQDRFAAALQEAGQPDPGAFVQDNHSCSHAGVLRGLHYQLPPHPQGKLVRVVRGAVFDVAVDLRRGSPTLGRWTGTRLSADNRRQMWIPPGFGHGFLTLEDDTHFLYKTTGRYARECERAIRWDDPALSIAWPLDGRPPRLAAKDLAAPLLATAEIFSS